jgi:hypothetical protein
MQSHEILALREASMSGLNGYVKADEIAARWNITGRQVQYLCQQEKIAGAVKFGNTWAIPENAGKPTRTGEKKPGRKPKASG